MKLMRLIVALAALMVCAAALADTIELKNGDKIEGRILEETEEAVRIETAYGVLRIPRSQIAKLTKDAPKPSEEKKEEEKKPGKAVIELKNGDKIEGEIVKETDEAITIKTPYGPLTIPRSQIVKVTQKAGAPSGLLEKKKQLADKHYELAMWAKERGLEEEVKLNLEVAISLYPDHEKARAALGFVKKDGEWVKGEKRPEPEKPEMTAEELMGAHSSAQQHLRAKEYDKALEVYKKILKSYPDDLTANYNTACVLSLQKRVEGALKYLEHAIRKAREALDKGSWEEQQGAQTILDLLKTDSDLDNLREADKFKEILKVAQGEKKEPEKEPEEAGKAYLTIQLAAIPRTPEAEQRMDRAQEFMRMWAPDLNIRKDKDNIYVEVGRYGLGEREEAEKRLKEVKEMLDNLGGMVPFTPKIITVEPAKKEPEGEEKPKKKERDF